MDPSGKTIPANNYSIPAGAIFMSPTGNDANPGTQSAPVKTLNRAIPLVPASGTLVLRGGEYRDWYSSSGLVKVIDKSITFQAFPGEQPWFNGTDPVTDGWAQAGTVWSRAWSTPQFCGGKYDIAVDGLSPVSPKLTRNSPCSYADSIRDPQYPVAGDPQLAFANGAQLRQVGTLAEVTPGSKTFFYDWNAKRIYISESPSANRIELATRPAALNPGGAYNFAIKGIGFRRYASSILGNAVVYVGLGGSALPTTGRLIVENTVFTENGGASLFVSGPKNGTVIRRSVFANTHFNGVEGFGYSGNSATARNDFLVENNVFSRINQGNIDTMCTASCGSAGIKMAYMRGYTLRGNIFEYAGGEAPGAWCDIDCSEGKFVGNVVRHNGGYGYFYEISNTGIIANNIFYHNNWASIAVPSANTKVYNNTIINKPGPNVQAMWLWDDKRVAPDKGETWPYWTPTRVKLGPNTNGLEVANNLIVAQQPNGARLLNFYDFNNVAPNTRTNEYFKVLDHNMFYTLPNQNLYGWGMTDAIKSPAQLRTVSGQNWETQTTHIVGSGDPFVNRAGFDFTIRSNSEVATSVGRTLPSDVVAATGLPSTPRRGAYIR